MMKKLIWILILGVEIAAAQQRAPRITPLPFGPAGSTANNFYKKGDPWFYHRLIGKGYTIQHENFTTYMPTYPLPPIEKYEHAVDEEGRDSCNDGYGRQISVDSLFALTKYRIRFPDYKGFEVYYMTGQADVDTLFPQQYKSCEMNYQLYGYLIFYERATKTARLLPAFYDWFGESVHKKVFYIDSSYRILTYSQMAYEGDDKADIDGGPLEEVKIDSKGKFTIKPLKFGRVLK